MNYVEEAQKLDPRINLLKNIQNMGALYTKSIGVFFAKGKYILSLDSDDMICIDDYIETLFIKAESRNFDYVECNEYIEVNLYNKTIKQKKITTMFLWVKLIKRNLYKNIIYRIGNHTLKRRINTLDDNFIILFLKNYKNFSKINKIGIFHFKHYHNQIYSSNFTNEKNKFEFCENSLNAIDALYDLDNDKENDKYYKKYSYYRLKNVLIDNECFKVPKIKENITSLFKKFLNSSFKNKKTKKIIKNILKELY